MRLSYLDNGNAYIAKTASLFWNAPRALVATLPIKNMARFTREQNNQ